MILGIGTDIVSIARLKQTRQNQGQKFLDRCFSETEAAYILAAQDDDLKAARLAKRWAAKEACAKALGTGIQGDIRLKDIQVVNDDKGRPQLVLKEGAQNRLNTLAAGHGRPVLHLSLSDDGDFAQAFVVLSTEIP